MRRFAMQLGIFIYVIASLSLAAGSTKVVDLRSEFLGNLNVVLTWRLSNKTTPTAVQDFVIQYRSSSHKSKGRYTTKDVHVSADEDGEYSTELKLKKHKRFQIQVQPNGQGGKGEFSEPTYIHIGGNGAVESEIGVTATPLSSTAVLISYDENDKENLENLDIFFAEKNGTWWMQVYKDITPFRGDNCLVLDSLQPSTTYFVQAKAWFEKVFKRTVTYVRTLGAAEPETQCPKSLKALSLAEQQNEEGVDTVDWSHWDIPGLQGYQATVTYWDQQPSQSRTEVLYLSRDKTSLDFPANSKTSIKVKPFDSFGFRGCAVLECLNCTPKAAEPLHAVKNNTVYVEQTFSFSSETCPEIVNHVSYINAISF